METGAFPLGRAARRRRGLHLVVGPGGGCLSSASTRGSTTAAARRTYWSAAIFAGSPGVERSADPRAGVARPAPPLRGPIGLLPSRHGEAPPRRHGPPERRSPFTGRRCGVRPSGCPTARSRRPPARSRACHWGSPRRSCEARYGSRSRFVVLPAMKRGLPEARLPFERPAVAVALVAASTSATLVRRSSLPLVPREAAVAMASLVPALVALRVGAHFAPRRRARLDGN